MGSGATPRRTKTYVAFDGDDDLMSFRNIQRWSADEAVAFTLNDAHQINYARDDSLPESICRQLKERLDRSKHLVLIVGTATSGNRKGILEYELKYALEHGLPIILVFKGFAADQASTKELWTNRLLPLIPGVIKNWAESKYCLVCPFTQSAVCSAVETFSHMNRPETTHYMWWWK